VNIGEWKTKMLKNTTQTERKLRQSSFNPKARFPQTTQRNATHQIRRRNATQELEPCSNFYATNATSDQSHHWLLRHVITWYSPWRLLRM